MKSENVGAIIQARMGSTRLPGKILKELDKNETVLDVLINRLKICKQIDKIIIATTPDEKNNAIIDVAKKNNVSWFVGDEDYVLKRYYDCAEEHKLDIIIRITSDCPFVDPYIADDMILFFKKNKYDYIRNVDETTNFSRGFEIEIFKFEVLKKVFSLAKTEPEKEHVTYFIYTNPEMFTLYSFNLENLKKFDDLRLTIDYEEDLMMCREVYKKLKEKDKSIRFSVFDIYEIIEENPELMNINKHIQQKKI